jgi:RNA polymerase sigma factor (sigma-70 family)
MTTSTISTSSAVLDEIGIPIFSHHQNNAPEFRMGFFLPEPAVPKNPVGVDVWSDAELVEAVRGEIPNNAALDELVARYSGSLFARCQMLTMKREDAFDLAQATWHRLLRNRRALRPDGNFPGYLTTIATNLFRDTCRAARRAGPMANSRLESLDAPCSNNGENTVFLADVLSDSKSSQAEEQTLLAIDLDRALGQLNPQMREVLVARYIDGESCAEIGSRYRRTEQTISGWIRKGLQQMKTYLDKPGH